jgi:glycosyltransferase involved in cell wall biosynthesis
MEITILTARWHASWPESSVCQNIDIHRLLPAPNSNWNENHFQKNVIAWLSKHGHRFDCIYVDRADSLLQTICNKASGLKLPVIARYSPEIVPSGLAPSQKIDAIQMASQCHKCAKIICPTPSSYRLITSHGMASSRICRIADYGWRSVDRSPETHQRAVKALFQTSSDFVIPARSDVILHIGVAELRSLRGALQSVCNLLDAGALLRMWVVGSGLPHSALYDLLKSRGWHREILLFDGFDDLKELMEVSDLLIVSNPTESLQYTLPFAARSGVPMMIADHPDCRAELPDKSLFQIYSTDRILEEKLIDWIRYRERWTDMAESLRTHCVHAWSAETIARHWTELYREVCKERTA